ncbi:MAG: hypothetical protein A3E88_05975 [Legionellales bacterium RIFCSPHIGHO2_12_FULL_35_11]|nr:MAG: hypothetical protein A3E88_05975 [Legionellales bacterium RIFCSPHIGHO2_12_FULL_35_11]
MQAIDAVISWVDGNDPIYQEKLNNYCAEHGINKKLAIEPTRIIQSNEIYYCLLSIKKFAPWIRNIYLITNQQIPAAISQIKDLEFTKKIKIVDQNILLKENRILTPVFNSLSIEWIITQIKDLSDNFLYLNDDFFLIKSVSPEDFFKNNIMQLRGEWKTKAKSKFSYKFKRFICRLFNLKIPSPKTNQHRSWQEHSATIAGYKTKFYLLPHAPFPLNKTTFNTYIKENPEALIKNASYPFRDLLQISAIPLMSHLDLKKNKAKHNPHSCQAIMVNGAVHTFRKIKYRLQKAKKKNKIKFVCMQSIDEAPVDIKKFLLNWLQCQINMDLEL